MNAGTEIPAAAPATRRDLARRTIRHALKSHFDRFLSVPAQYGMAREILAEQLATGTLNAIDCPFLHPALRALSD